MKTYEEYSNSEDYFERVKLLRPKCNEYFSQGEVNGKIISDPVDITGVFCVYKNTEMPSFRFTILLNDGTTRFVYSKDLVGVEEIV